MPLYEYRCESCGHQFEVIQKFSDALIAVCPKCGSGPVVKLFSSPAIQFKGSGFYITDYGKKDSDLSGKADKAEKAEKAKSEKSDKSEKKDTGSSTTETKSSPDKTEKAAEKKSSDTSAAGTSKPSKD